MSTFAQVGDRSTSHDVLNLSVAGQTAHSSAKVTDDDEGRRRGAGKGPRHYPLDLDGLLFERYEHRRLGVRETLVSRVVADLMGSTRSHHGAKMLDMSSTSSSTLTSPKLLNMEERGQDLEIELDLQLLEDMTHLVLADKPLRDARLKKQCDQRNGESTTGSSLPKSWTIGDRILDLVQRHYIEVDEAATKQWFRIMRLPQGQIQPFRPKPPTAGALADPTRTVSATLPTKPRRGTRAAALQSCEARRNHSRLVDRGGIQDDALDLKKHRKSLERFAKTQDSMHLYDGGAIRPWNNQVLDFSRTVTAHQISLVGHESITPLWPHSRVLRRFKVRVAWRHRRKLKDPLFVTAHPPFKPARGRGPFKYYAENCRSRDSKQLSSPDRRERSLSEPPAGMFAHAKLPRPAHHGPIIEMEIAYPRLSLAQIDRRSRRRSLDRANIEDMLGAIPIRGNRTLASHPPGQTKGMTADDDDDSCVRGLQDPSPERVEKRRVGYCKGPMIIQRGVWCTACDSFHPLSDLHNLTVEPGPVQATYNSREVGLVTSSSRAREEQRSSAFRSCLDTLPNSEVPYETTCSNCTDGSHSHNFCFLRCGHCGGIGADANIRDPDRPKFQIIRSPPPGLPGRLHQAHDCEVSQRNRCKCVSFPTFHTANDCTITCSRPCGNPWPPGHYRHRNAMTCTHRCCMCGLRGHSGKDCNLTKNSCLCGAHHLGQDCGWKVECRVPGCDRYNCRLHCRRCDALRTPKGFKADPALRFRLCAACTAMDVKREEEQHAINAAAIWSRLLAEADGRYRWMDQSPAAFVDSPFELFRETLCELTVGLIRDLFWPGQVDLPTGKSNYVNYQISQLRDVSWELSSTCLGLLDDQDPEQLPSKWLVEILDLLEWNMKGKRGLVHEELAKGKQASSSLT